MNIALTGHTKGLGSAIYENLGQKYNITGFSRTNGYDIKSPMDRKRLIRESKDCDVFINLVHNYYHQTDMLFEMFKCWEGSSKLIINVSSDVVDDQDWGLERLDYIEYKNQKIALESMGKLLTKRQSKPQIVDYRIAEINYGADVSGLNTIINEFQISKK